MVTFDIRSNNFISSIPSEIGSWSSTALRIYLSDNSFEGTLPSQIGSLKKARDVYLDHNQLYGSVPAELADMTKLDEV